MLVFVFNFDLFKFSAAILEKGLLCPRGKGAVRLSLCEAPTRETRSDHNTGNYVPLIMNFVIVLSTVAHCGSTEFFDSVMRNKYEEKEVREGCEQSIFRIKTFRLTKLPHKK